jgi:Zn-dependent protease
MLAEMNSSPVDVKWRMFGIPCRIHPSFWLVAAFFAFSWVDLGIQFWFMGIGLILFTVLAHELGHALMFRAYHMPSRIVLYSFGGLAIPDGRLPARSWRIIVSLAGPLVNFLIAGIAWGSEQVAPWATTNMYTFVLYVYGVYVNLFLGLLNLLPVWPLDGGQISRELWQQAQPMQGLINSLKMSFVVALVFSIYAFACHFNLIPPELIRGWFRPGLFAAILFLILAAENYQALQFEQSRFNDFSDRPPWS